MTGNTVEELLGHASGFKVSARPHVTAVEVVRGRKAVPVELTARGRRVIDNLLAAAPETLERVEQLLSAAAPAGVTRETISPMEAALLLGVSRPTVVKWAAEGLLSDLKKGAHHQFLRREVLALCERRLAEAEANRSRAVAERTELRAAGVDLDRAPSAQEMAAAGAAWRHGDRDSARSAVARGRVAAAKEAAAAAAAR